MGGCVIKFPFIRNAATYVRHLDPREQVIVLGRSSTVLNVAPDGGNPIYDYSAGKTTVVCYKSLGKDVTSIRLAFAGWYVGLASEVDISSALTVKVGFQLGKPSPSNTNPVIPLYFNGQRTGTIVPGFTKYTDALDLNLPAGSEFNIRTYCVGADVPLGPRVMDGYGETIFDSDTVDTQAVSLQPVTNTAFVYAPAAVTGVPVERLDPVVGVGDSIVVGAYEPTNTYPTFDGYGWVARSAALVGRPYINMALSASLADTDVSRRAAMLHALGNSIVIVEFGGNDIGAGGTPPTGQEIFDVIVADLQTLYSVGIRLVPAVVLPRASSTDNFVTEGNQTPIAPSSVWGPNGERSILNRLLREIAGPGILACLDVCNNGDYPAESGIDTGKWFANGVAGFMVTDNVHPTVSGANHIASYASKALGVSVPTQTSSPSVNIALGVATITPGVYSAAVCLQYQWFVDDVLIEDAIAKTYVVQPADSGKVVRCRERAIHVDSVADYSASAVAP